MTLPPLPDPDTHCLDDDTGLDVWSHSPKQMRAYAEQAVAQETERLRRTAAPQQIGSADIETKDENHDLHRRSVAIMAKALDYSARMTEAMERIASVATDWRGSKPGEQK